MGCSQSSEFEPLRSCKLRLEIVNHKGRTRIRPDVLTNIINGRSSSRIEPSVLRSRLYLTAGVLQGNLREAFVQGMQQHSWIQLEELALCPCGMNLRAFETLMSALRDQHVHIKKLCFKMQYEGNIPSLDRLTDLIGRQTLLEELDLSRSYVYTFRLKSFVRAVILDHPNLKKLVLNSTNVGDPTATLVFRALSGRSIEDDASDENNNNNEGSSSGSEDIHNQQENNNVASATTTRSEPRLEHLEISSSATGFGSMGVSSTVELFKYLPYMHSLKILVLEHLTFRALEEPRSPTYEIHHIVFLDVLYQRFNLLEGRLPSTLWPLLGYLEEKIDGVEAAPYFSKRTQVWNQLLLAGLPVTTLPPAANPHVPISAATTTTESVRSRLLPDWKACWDHPVLGKDWRECCLFPSVNQSRQKQQQGQENSFKATALFSMLRERLVVESSIFAR